MILLKLKLMMLTFLLAGNAKEKLNSSEPVDGHINEERFVRLNGIEQWITIKGDTSKQVILFLHGGPGSPLSPYADAIYGSWENDYVLVQWDQRGSGRTFGRNAPEELTPDFLRANPLTLEQMTEDGLALCRYILKYLGKEELILFGSSWGSILGVKMAQRNPELFQAYIGHSQVVNPLVSDLSAYQRVLEMARRENDEHAIRILTSMGSPPYDTARNTGRFIQIVKKYQQKNAIPVPPSWFTPAALYDNELDNWHRSEGDDYSFVHYAGDKKLGVASISAEINFLDEAYRFEMPVYLIQGELDLQTPAAITKSYYDKLVGR